MNEKCTILNFLYPYNDPSVIYNGLDRAQDYYLFLESENNYLGMQYQLSLGVIEDDDFEENDDMSHAALITTTEVDLMAFDDDWYTYTCGIGGNFSIVISESSSGRLDFEYIPQREH